MGLERMNCCGAFTRVYSDAGNRKHNKGCSGRVEKRVGRRVWTTLERSFRLRKTDEA